ncbi:MAG: hypothetical protein KC414_15085, partial [Romboutsia sp.]|nr:hypothetical protein [Romboutsia sp.]
NTQYMNEFVFLFQQYLFYNEFDVSDIPPSGLPPVSIKLSNNKKSFLINGRLPIDVSESVLKDLMKLLFKNVRDTQKELGIKVIRGTRSNKSFLLNARIYSIYEKLVREEIEYPKQKVYENLEIKDLEVSDDSEKIAKRLESSIKKINRTYQ